MIPTSLLLVAVGLVVGGATLGIYVMLASRAETLRRRIDAIRTVASRASTSNGVTTRIIRTLALAGRHLFGLREQRELVNLMTTHRIPTEIGVAGALALRVLVVFGSIGAALAFGLSDGRDGSFLFAAVGPLAIAAIAWFVPDILLRSLASSRLREIERQLPEALEMLVICSEAGLALDAGLKRVIDEMRSHQPEISQELAITLADLTVLPERELALRRLAERVQLESLTIVTSTLIQTMRFGTPLAKALRNMAAELRNESISRLEERANRLPVILTVPMIVFLLPAIFLVVGGPALLRVLDVIGK